MILKSYTYIKKKKNSYFFHFPILIQNFLLSTGDIRGIFQGRMERTIGSETRTRNLKMVSRGWSDERRQFGQGWDRCAVKSCEVTDSGQARDRGKIYLEKRYRWKQSVVEKPCESRHKFYLRSSQKTELEDSFFFLRGWWNQIGFLFFLNIVDTYSTKEKRNCMKILRRFETLLKSCKVEAQL